MRIAISTRWNCHRHEKADSMLEEIRSLGFDTVELAYGTTQTQIDGLRKWIDSGEIKVGSVHAFCPNIVPGVKSHPELFSLCDPEDSKRGRRGIAAAVRCADFAAEIGAKTVVMHAGRVPVFKHANALGVLAEKGLADTPKFEKQLLKTLGKRDKKSGVHLDTLYESLEETLPRYAERGVTLALENLPTCDAMPNETEMAELLREFDDMPLAYWHDLGHGQIRHHHRIANHKAIVSGFRRNIAGFHIHDVIFPGNDHQLPGVEGGTVDFKLLRPFVDSDVQFVLEPTTAASAQQLAQSLRFLQEQLSQT